MIAEGKNRTPLSRGLRFLIPLPKEANGAWSGQFHSSFHTMFLRLLTQVGLFNFATQVGLLACTPLR